MKLHEYVELAASQFDLDEKTVRDAIAFTKDHALLKALKVEWGAELDKLSPHLSVAARVNAKVALVEYLQVAAPNSAAIAILMG